MRNYTRTDIEGLCSIICIEITKSNNDGYEKQLISSFTVN